MKSLPLLLITLLFTPSCDDDNSSSGGGVCSTLLHDPCEAQNRGPCVEDDTAPEGYTCTCSEAEHFLLPACCEEEPSPEGCTCDAPICCRLDMVNLAGQCRCAPGFVENPDTGTCEPSGGTVCEPNPCAGGAAGVNRTRCVPEGEASYRCECAEGWEENSNGACIITIQERCTGGDSCLAGYCVSGPAEGQCVATQDCHTNVSAEEGNPTYCNPAAVGGICLGCTGNNPNECPTGFSCTEFNTCAKPCSGSGECPHGTCHTSSGYCVQSSCSSNADCMEGTVCVDEDNTGTGMCQRIPCLETDCSIYNPEGECPQGEACLNGACTLSCDPNPCQEINREVCTETPNGPVCSCNDGYEESATGECVPAICPRGFVCQAGYCTDPQAFSFCSTDADCGGTLTCNPTLPTGTCRGCTSARDCPMGADECLAGYCLRLCTSGCAEGMECKPSGYCGFKGCTSEGECQPGYTCSTTTNRCERIPCD